MHRQKSLIRTIVEPLLLAIILATALRTMVRICAVPSGSMAPALTSGDRIVVTLLAPAQVERGDVVVFRHPAQPGELAVKRVIAVPGDLIESQLGRVRISGRTIDEPYAELSSTAEIAPQVIPADHVFVLGDNRGESLDSRHWGPLPTHLVIGQARMVLWSSRRAGRPSRIFKWIE